MPDIENTKEYERLLYTNNLYKKSFQWELWQCCNNLCSFCYLGKNNRHNDKDRQLKSLKDLLGFLEDFDFNTFNNVSLIGGEFFQGQLEDQEIRDLFYQVIRKLASFYVDKKIGSIWVAATLTIGDQADLYEMLDIFEDAGVKPHPDYGASGVWICTSWDPQGRFHTKGSEKNWEFHMKNMSENYPHVKKNTTIILTQRLLEMYLNGDYVPRKFMRDFQTCLFYKQANFFDIDSCDSYNHSSLASLIKGYKEGRLPEEMMRLKERHNEELGYEFYPRRATFRKFLLKYASEDKETFDKICNINYRADELYRNFDCNLESEQYLRDKSSNFESDAFVDMIPNEDCQIREHDKKHTIGYATYGDSNACVICDRNQVWKSLYGETNPEQHSQLSSSRRQAI
jgi:hypothetical protein